MEEMPSWWGSLGPESVCVLGGSPGCGQSLPGPAQTFQASEMLAWAQEQVTLPRSM